MYELGSELCDSAQALLLPCSFKIGLWVLLSQYDGFTRIFTDGSKAGETVGAAAIVASRVHNKRLPNNASIFSAEACGILLALDMVRHLQEENYCFFVTLSCLHSLQKRDLSHPLITEILCRVHGLLSSGTDVVFMWVPSHVGLAGNSVADTAAKAALLLPMSNNCSSFGLQLTDTYSSIKPVATKLEF
jgi:kelch-like protein 2/3